MNLRDAAERGTEIFHRVMEANNEAWQRAQRGESWLCRCGYWNLAIVCTKCGEYPAGFVPREPSAKDIAQFNRALSADKRRRNQAAKQRSAK